MKIDIQANVIELELNRDAIRACLQQSGKNVQKAAQNLIRSGSANGRHYGSHIASAPGQAPASQTGALAKSIKVRMSRDGTKVTILDSQYYSLSLEAGAQGGGSKQRGRAKRGTPETKRRMEPRPYLSTALEQLAPQIKKGLEEAITIRPVS